MRDITLVPMPDPNTLAYEHVATCALCSFDQYGIMLTRARAKLWRLAGALRCTHCRYGLMDLEELTGFARLTRQTA